MTPNDLLLAHLAAASDDATLLRAMAEAVFGVTGEIGPQGFGATTLEGHLVLFTQPEFYAVAGLPPGLDAVEVTAQQASDYAQVAGLRGFVLNPGTHQRFVPGTPDLNALTPEPPVVPALVGWSDPSPAVVRAVADAAEGSAVTKVWLAMGPVVVTEPHPDAAFESGLLARDIRIKSFGAHPAWSPVYERGAPARARVRFSSLSESLPPALAADLASHAQKHGLRELWAFQATVEDEPATLAFAYAPHPHDRFAQDFDVLHARHSLGAESPLLDADTLREALPRIGLRLL